MSVVDVSGGGASRAAGPGGKEEGMGFRRSGAVPVCLLLLALALSLPFSTPALGQDVASGVAELRRLFEDELLFDRLTPDSAVKAVKEF